jgi:hypothetical protein
LEFRLIYRGSLPAQNNGGGGGLSKEKHAIRKEINRQLAVLWQENPVLSLWMTKPISVEEAGVTRTYSAAEHAASRYASYGFNWLPLVREELGIAAALDILFLRRDAPGKIIGGGGDIDNRLKVLFDALRKPKHPEEVAGFVAEEGENPFFCLLEDDVLINDVRINTGDEAMAKLLDSPPSKTATWRDLLICRTSKSGSPRPERLLANAMIALRYAPDWDGVVGFNSFSQRVVTLSETPWGTSAGTLWSDVEDSLTTEWLQKEGGIFVSSDVVAEAVQTVAQERQFHPVRKYLEGLVWDGVRRIDNWLATYLGCQESEFIRAVGPRWLISAAARVFKPGCQVDCVLLLEGPQGLKKSSALRALVGDEWFTDHLAELGSKDSRLDLLGKWVVEMSELASLRKTETEKVKAFLTARTDHFRPPYGRRAMDVPRQNVFAASTNEQQPLVDSTGNRRFWPASCGRSMWGQSVVIVINFGPRLSTVSRRASPGGSTPPNSTCWHWTSKNNATKRASGIT